MDTTKDIELAVVDDDPLFLDFVSSLLSLEGGIRVLSLESEDALMTALQAQHIDCIVMDYDLGQSNGLAVGERLKVTLSDPPPIVMLTGGGSERTAVKAFRSGFSDYVSKRSFKVAELVGAVRGAVDRHAAANLARTEASAMRERLNHDQTSGLYNTAFMEALLDERTGKLAQRPFALILIELPQLETMRAELGYVMVQRIISRFATFLQSALTAEDICGHGDGDSFLILIDSAPTTAAAAAAATTMIERLSDEVTKEIVHDRVAVRLTPAIGSAVFPVSGNNPQALLAAARSMINGQPQTVSQPQTARAPAQTATAGGQAAEGKNSQASTVAYLHERRKERRQRVLRRAKILVNRNNTVIDCNVRDLSSSGAHLRVDSYFAVPDEFDLTIVGSGSKRQVRTRWQVGNDIGVEFVGGAHEQ